MPKSCGFYSAWPCSDGARWVRHFARFLTAGAFDIVQPDTTKGGGLSESRRVVWLADDLHLAAARSDVTNSANAIGHCSFKVGTAEASRLVGSS